MRVLIINLIVNTAEKGRIPRYATNYDSMIYNMARGFVALGHEVTLIADEAFAPLQTENNPFEAIYLPGRMRKVFRPDLLPCPKGLYSYLKQNSGEFDLVLTSEVFSIGTLIAARIKGLRDRIVIWQELSLYQRFLFKLPAKLWYNMVFPMLAGRGIRVVARSIEARRFISRYCRVVSDTIVDHGVNAEILTGVSAGMDESFVVVSQLIKRKRVDRIIRVFAEFVGRVEFKNYKLNVIGDGAEKQSLMALTDRLGIGDSVIFHGRLSQRDWAPLSASSAGLLVDTARDLNMVSITESIANGTPVLTNSIPTTASYIYVNRLGIVKDDWGADELAAMVRCRDEFHRNCMAVRESLTNVGAAGKIITIFNSL